MGLTFRLHDLGRAASGLIDLPPQKNMAIRQRGLCLRLEESWLAKSQHLCI